MMLHVGQEAGLRQKNVGGGDLRPEGARTRSGGRSKVRESRAGAEVGDQVLLDDQLQVLSDDRGGGRRRGL